MASPLSVNFSITIVDQKDPKGSRRLGEPTKSMALLSYVCMWCMSMSCILAAKNEHLPMILPLQCRYLVTFEKGWVTLQWLTSSLTISTAHGGGISRSRQPLLTLS